MIIRVVDKYRKRVVMQHLLPDNRNPVVREGRYLDNRNPVVRYGWTKSLYI